MKGKYERMVTAVLIFTVTAGAAMVVLSELYPDETEENVSGHACVAEFGR